jgi:hypothetical protein
MHEISQNPPQLHQQNASKHRAKSRPRRRVASLLSLVWFAFCHCLFCLFCFRPAPAPTISAEALTGGSPAAISTARLSQVQLNDRAPLIDQEAARFTEGKRETTLRRVYQATGLASQGGAIDPTVRHVAAISGVCERTVQRASIELERRGLSRRVFHKVARKWNRPNTYRF